MGIIYVRYMMEHKHSPLILSLSFFLGREKKGRVNNMVVIQGGSKMAVCDPR